MAKEINFNEWISKQYEIPNDTPIKIFLRRDGFNMEEFIDRISKFEFRAYRNSNSHNSDGFDKLLIVDGETYVDKSSMCFGNLARMTGGDNPENAGHSDNVPFSDLVILNFEKDLKYYQAQKVSFKKKLLELASKVDRFSKEYDNVNGIILYMKENGINDLEMDDYVTLIKVKELKDAQV